LRLGGIDSGFPRQPLLLQSIDLSLLCAQGSLSLLDLLEIDTVIDPDEELTLLDRLEICHRNLRDISRQLWRQDRDLAAHIGVVGDLDRAGERRQLPGVEHDQYTTGGNDKCYRGGNETDELGHIRFTSIRMTRPWQALPGQTSGMH